MKNILGKAALALSIVLTGGSALAEVITLNQTVSLPAPTDFYHGRAVFTSFINFADPLLIHQGDTIDLSIRFGSGQSIHMVGHGEDQAFAMQLWQDNTRNPPNTSSFTISNSSFNLTGAQGSFPAMLNLPDLSGGQASIFTSVHGNFLAAGQDATFTGMHARFTVSALQNGESYYHGTTLYAYAEQLSVNTAPVPEPETWALMLGGLGLLAFMHKRRASAL